MYTRWANDLGATFKMKSAWLVRRLSNSSSFAHRLTRFPQHPDSLVTADPLALAHIFTKVPILVLTA